MAKTITINPVTRIEGHAKITIQLDDAGRVSDAQFHVTQFRGFEKFVEGRPLREMPSIMARICGICPVSHLMASSKACDDLLAVEIPPAAVLLRTLMNLGQLVQSHALSFFHLSSPDLLLGMDADPKERNIFGLIKANPGFATDGVRLRKFGQEIIERLGGKRIHPAWCVPGGVNAPLTREHRDAIREGLAEAFDRARRVLDWLASTVHRFEQEIESFANFPTLFMGLVGPDGQLEHYDGALRVCDARGAVVVDIHDPRRYGEYIGEHVEPWSYLKSPYFRPGGYPDGIYRVGPLARLICAERCGTPLADEALTVFRERWGRAPSSSFHYHWARLIEIVYGLERIARLLDDPAILDERVQSTAGVNRLEGVGISEAPRGTIIHHYKISPDGLMQWANLIIATGHNNLAMNRGVKQVAERFVDGKRLEEGMLNRVEAVVRAFDPCLSCSTHAWGQMPLEIQLRDAAGQIVDRLVRADNA
ncbi:MAG: Ni/Fe hydrogenase subunit alpha [Planctomycetota bacterium]